MKRTISTIGLVAAFAIGCGSTVPEARVASTETAVQSARASGADRDPEASRHLKMAEAELSKAKALNGKREGDEASALLSRAESDAALAAALSDEAKQKAWAAGAGTTTTTGATEPSEAPSRAKQPPPQKR